MAVKTREEIINDINTRFGADNSDEVIALIEDVTDTFAVLEGRANPDGKDWKSEAERIDKEWREKYVARFTSGGKDDDDIGVSKPEPKKSYSYNDLFK